MSCGMSRRSRSIWTVCDRKRESWYNPEGILQIYIYCCLLPVNSNCFWSFADWDGKEYIYKMNGKINWDRKDTFAKSKSISVLPLSQPLKEFIVICKEIFLKCLRIVIVLWNTYRRLTQCVHQWYTQVPWLEYGFLGKVQIWPEVAILSKIQG